MCSFTRACCAQHRGKEPANGCDALIELIVWKRTQTSITTSFKNKKREAQFRSVEQAGRLKRKTLLEKENCSQRQKSTPINPTLGKPRLLCCVYSSTYHQLGFLLWLNLVENEGYVFFVQEFLVLVFYFFV